MTDELMWFPMNRWLVALTRGWALCGIAPRDERGYTVLMWRRVAA